jgi:hypothetical protein
VLYLQQLEKEQIAVTRVYSAYLSNSLFFESVVIHNWRSCKSSEDGNDHFIEAAHKVLNLHPS